jgi:uncharacterized protein (TIGR03067 family)
MSASEAPLSRPFALAILAAALLPLSAGAFQANKDQNRLQGKWTGHLMDGTGDRPSQRRGDIAEMLITAKTISAKDRQRSMGEGTYRLDSRPQPGYLDADGTEGQSRGRSYLGIYKFVGEQLHWCVANPGRPRPTEFRTRTGAQFLMILNRAPG